ncbi:hypothetical protein JTE90_025672, partial [Oedothorax gibbosus]
MWIPSVLEPLPENKEDSGHANNNMDLTIEYVTDASSGDQTYPKDMKGDEMYRQTGDVKQLFAKRDGRPYYATTKDGFEYYPQLL